MFKSSGGSEGFRRFSLPDKTPLRVFRLDDFSNFQPFERAHNRTAVVCIQKGQPTQYPVDYFEWSLVGKNDGLGETAPLLSSQLLKAWPVQVTNPRSPWISIPEASAAGIRKVLGASPFEAKLGVHTWLNGAYWLRQDIKRPKGERFVGNAYDVGKKQVMQIETSVEGDLVYPLLRGRDVRRWIARPSLSIILPHDAKHPGVGIPEVELKRTHRRAYDYFMQLRPSLIERSGYKKFIKPAGGPFYGVYNIGSYTFRPYRVVWREQASTIQACVVSTATDGRFVIPESQLQNYLERLS